MSFTNFFFFIFLPMAIWQGLDIYKLWRKRKQCRDCAGKGRNNCGCLCTQCDGSGHI